MYLVCSLVCSAYAQSCMSFSISRDSSRIGRAMDALPDHGFLEFRPDTLEVVRRGVGLHRPGEMADAVRILDQWVKQQKHFLNKNIHPVTLEMLIVMRKGSLERAKAVLDKWYTVRTHLPQYFDPYDIEKEYEIIKGTSYIVSLPKLTEEQHRVMVWKFVGKFPPRIVAGVYRTVFTVLDYHTRWDYPGGAELIYDVSQVDLRDVLATLNLVELKNAYMILFESYGLRINRIHLITASKLVYTLINFFKRFLKKKIMDRMIIHESYEELHRYYPKHMLPSDFGGTERSLEELQEDFISHLTSDEHQAYMKELSGMRVDETQKPTNMDDVFSGTFRALAID